MNSEQVAKPRRLNLGWHRFGLAIAVMSVIPIAFAWLGLTNRTLGAPTVSVILNFLSIICFFTYRFHRLRSAVSQGAISEAMVLAKPIRHFAGPLLPLTIWFVATAILVIGIPFLMAHNS